MGSSIFPPSVMLALLCFTLQNTTVYLLHQALTTVSKTDNFPVYMPSICLFERLETRLNQ